MNFGEALIALKAGHRVTRDGWNGAGMWLVLVPGSTITVEAGRPLGDAAPELIGQQVDYLPHIDMRTAQGDIVPWLASQTDVLSEDWRVQSPTAKGAQARCATVLPSGERCPSTAHAGAESCRYHAGPKSRSRL